MIDLKRNDFLEITLAAIVYSMLPAFLIWTTSLSPLLLIWGLFFPLPIYFITLKRGHIAGLMTIGLSFFLSILTGMNLSLLVMGLPVVFLCHKALKSRQGLNNRLEWYPLSLLIQWSSIFSIGIALLIGVLLYLVISPQPQAFLETVIHYNPSLKDKLTLEAITTLYNYMPSIFACYWMAVQFLNGYAAQLVLEKINKNIRPMPSFLNMTIKNYWYYGFIFCLVMVLLFDGIYGHLFQNLTVCFMIPLFFMGLSVTHHGLKMIDNRLKPFIFIFYVLFFLLPTLSLIIVALGIVEPWVELRKKFDVRRKR